MAQKGSAGRFVLCIRNDECEDLQRGKVYPAWPDTRAAKEGYLRVVDESGDDYLYPASYFVSVAYMCWAFRRRGVNLDGRGNATEWLY